MSDRNTGLARPLARQGLHDRVAELLTGLPQGRLLDVPAGMGALARRLAEQGFTVTCADINADDFLARELPFEQADLSATLPFADGAFDYVTCIEGVEHLENPFRAVRELARVLRPGGTLILSLPNYLSIEQRLKFLITGSFDKPVPTAKVRALAAEEVAMLHLAPLGYGQLKLMLDLAGLEVERLERDKSKRRQAYFLWPLVLAIKFYTRLWPRSARQRYLLDEVEGPALLTGGNTLIILAGKTPR